MAGRVKKAQFSNEFSPGPGAYSVADKYVSNKSSAPRYGMGSAPKQVKDISTRRHVPGPGAYEPKHPEKNQKTSFPLAARVQPKKELSPGPGAYKIPTKVSEVPTYALPN